MPASFAVGWRQVCACFRLLAATAYRPGPDFDEAVAAFAERRRPVFQGR